jgi:signal transduction histidine kinase
MDVSGKEMPLPKAVSIQLYRIIQEFIRNSQKHSGATEVILRIKLSDASMELLLTDNGRGFDMEKEQANGIGLLNMTKRVRVFNGKCLYKTGEGKGVRLHILVPLSNIESGSQTKNYTC